MRESISRNRSFIMGMAILWVAVYHLPGHFAAPAGFLQDAGYGGVDLFVFLSGFGVCRSLEREPDPSAFFLRRLKRLLPSYIPFILMWMFYRKLTGQIFVTEICGNLTLTGWWNQDANQFNWYPAAILFFYLLAPFLYGLIRSAGNRRRMTAFLVCLFLVVSIAFWHGQLLIAMTRIPLFVLGIAVGMSREDTAGNGIVTEAGPKGGNGASGTEQTGGSGRAALSREFILLNVLLLIGAALLYWLLYLQVSFDKWHYGLWWYPFLLMAPGITVDLALLGEFCAGHRFCRGLRRLVEVFGRSSFEIFLIHIFFFEEAQKRGMSGWISWAVLFAAAFVLGTAFSEAVCRARAAAEKRWGGAQI